MATNQVDSNKSTNQTQDVMVFILVLAMSGLQNLIAEIIPELEMGLIEVGISTFWFVPLVLCILFNSWWAAFAAPLGEIVFSDLILGEFGGLGEFEEVFLVAVALFIAGRMVTDPKNRSQVAIAALASFILAEGLATFIDMFKVWVGVEELEAVEGLPESIVILELVDFAVEFIISGLIFGLIPALPLAPRLHGKIEPLMGMKPRQPGDAVGTGISGGIILVAVVAFLLATLAAVLSEIGFNIVEWEPEFLDTVGQWFIWIAIAAAAVVVAIVFFLRAAKRSSE